jgi:hypothetical protein
MLLNAATHTRLADLNSLFLPAKQLRNIKLWLCAALCVLPCLVEAVQIGDILSTSKLGEPLRVEVALTTAANEQIDDSCVSLVAPDTRTDDTSNYLRDTKLSVQNIGGQQRILLNARKPFNDVFGKFKLQIKCRDQGSIAKTFTILPDLADSVPLPEQVASAIEPAVTPQIKVEPVPAKQAPQANVAIEVPVVAQPAIAKSPTHHSTRTKPASPDVSQPRVARRTRSNHLGSFQLKISGEPLDASRIGKISPEERTFLLGSQKLLDSDDQMASILTLQNQVKQLQDDISQMRAKISMLDTSPAHINPNSEANSNPVTETNPTQVAASATSAVTIAKHVSTQKTLLSQQTDWRTWAWQLGLLGLAILGVIWVLRRSSKSKSFNADEQFWPEIEQTEPKQAAKPLPVEQVISPTTQDYFVVTPIEITPNDPAIDELIPFTKSTPPHYILDTQSEADTIIEEAQLYATHNHPLRAIKLLQELLAQQPTKTDAWLLLLAISSSLNHTIEFEKHARTFLRYHPKESEAWEAIRVLGQTLNPDDPLYKDDSPKLSPSTILGDRHLIGDILIDLNMILPETLHHCLANFDPDQHGRFGVYLVTEKVITHEQLTQALVHQHTLNHGVPFAAPEPVLLPEPPKLEFELPDNNWQG